MTQHLDNSSPVLVVQHAAPEGPCLISDTLNAVGLGTTLIRTDRAETVPNDASAFAAVVVMGGPMCAADDDGFPTRSSEIRLLSDALQCGVPILGVCLGAQLLAVAAGSEIHRGGPPEIGWGEVELRNAVTDDRLFSAAGSPGDKLTVLHWHSDTFDVPAGASLLASSSAYESQAIRIGDCAWGLQFHIEVDMAAVAGFVGAFGEEAAAAPGGASRILDCSRDAMRDSYESRIAILTNFARIAAEPRNLRKN